MSAIVLRGDARDLPLPNDSVDLIVTSPPYWNLRDYRDDGESLAGQIGAEDSPHAYVDALLECTKEWVRVLKASGSIFVVLGDKYSTGNSGESRLDEWSARHAAGGAHADVKAKRSSARVAGLPPKSLLGLPWRYALGCADQLGLILRAEIVWAKLNGLPESVQDRVRRSHEQVFHFTKEPRYYSAVDEIRESSVLQSGLAGTFKRARSSHDLLPGQSARQHRDDRPDVPAYNPLGKLPGSVWEIASTPLVAPEHLGISHFAAFPLELPRRIILGWSPAGICDECGQGRFPVTQAQRVELRHRDLPGRARLNRDTVHGMDQRAGTHVMNRTAITGYACACTPYTDHEGAIGRSRGGQGYAVETGRDAHPHGGVGVLPRTGPWREYNFDGWTPAATRPAVVVDPFGGTGTTALVADVLGRAGISVDRSADYCRLAQWRTTDPGERARAMQVPKPPPVPDGQASLFEFGGEVA